MALRKRMREFKDTMDAQIGLLDQVAAKQEDLRTHLVERNWPSLDGVIKELERISTEIARVEDRRVGLQREIAAVGEVGKAEDAGQSGDTGNLAKDGANDLEDADRDGDPRTGNAGGESSSETVEDEAVMFAALRGDRAPGIKAILRRCNDEERRELNDAFRRLKIAVLRVQAGARGIRSYTTEAAETTRDILHELFPGDTQGQYSRDGEKRHGTQRALILDHTL